MAQKQNAQGKKTRPSGRGNVDVTFLVLVLLLLTFGLIMLFSASYAYAYYHDNDSFYYIKKQMIFAVAGIVAMIVASNFDYRYWQNCPSGHGCCRCAADC